MTDRAQIVRDAEDAARAMAGIHLLRFLQAISEGDEAEIGRMFLDIWRVQHQPSHENDESAPPRKELSDDELNLLAYNKSR